MEDAPEGRPAPTPRESVLGRVSAPSDKPETAAEAQPQNLRSRPLPRVEETKRKPSPPSDTPAPVAVKDKPGFVMSPFIDVRDIPPGTLVADPTYPVTQKKYFRVP